MPSCCMCGDSSCAKNHYCDACASKIASEELIRTKNKLSIVRKAALKLLSLEEERSFLMGKEYSCKQRAKTNPKGIGQMMAEHGELLRTQARLDAIIDEIVDARNDLKDALA